MFNNTSKMVSSLFKRTQLSRLLLLPRRFTAMSIILGVAFGCVLATVLSQAFHVYVRPEVNEIEGVDYEANAMDNFNATYLNMLAEENGRKLEREVRVLCFVLTKPGDKKYAKAVKETWGPRCNQLLFMSTGEDSDLPSVKLAVKEGNDRFWGLSREAFRHAWNNYKDKVDWFLRVDDDTYVIVENMRYFLSGFDTSQPYWFGHKLKTDKNESYFSPGPGYIMSREATRRFVEEGYFNNLLCKHDHVGDEGKEMGKCMHNLNVSAMDTRDSQGRARFSLFHPEKQINLKKDKSQLDFLKSEYYPYQPGVDCCSDSAISFHEMDPDRMYLMDFFIYHIRPYALPPDLRKQTPEPPPDLELTATPWEFKEEVTTTTTLAPKPADEAPKNKTE